VPKPVLTQVKERAFERGRRPDETRGVRFFSVALTLRHTWASWQALACIAGVGRVGDGAALRAPLQRSSSGIRGWAVGQVAPRRRKPDRGGFAGVLRVDWFATHCGKWGGRWDSNPRQP
jgi:hypothetical protein